MSAPTPTSSPQTLPLNDGFQIPRLGLGVWQIEDADVGKAVTTAIGAGYRLIDTAQGYDNERGVGEGLAGIGLERGELFVTSKLRTKAMGYDEAIEGVRISLEALRLDYLDLMLIHWPTPARNNYVETWNGLIQAREEGLVGSIGVSNFLIEHVERLIEETGVIPAVNQVELHPYFQQQNLREFHEKHGIRLESYSPLGHGEALEDAAVAELAQRYGKSPAQIILRWHVQQNLIVIPKSQTPERIRENFEVFDFELTDDEMNQINGLDRGEEGRTSSDPATFNDEY